MQNLDLSNIKCVIFDFDSTLYTGADWYGHSDYFYGLFVDIGVFNSISEAHEKLLELYPNEPAYEQRAVFFLNENNLMEKFMQRREEIIFDIMSNNMEFCNYKNLEELSKFYKLYIISDSPENYVHFYMKKFGIDESYFEFVRGNKYLKEDITKLPLMRDAMIDAGASIDETLMVGDSLKYDKLPAERLGIKFYHTTSVNDTDAIILKLLELKK